ncbi:hypothetical protein [Endothiovibrio diazotrophicus]
MVGASLDNGNTPINGVLGGIKVGFGSYQDLGTTLAHALILTKGRGYVVNEAEAGATTFARADRGWSSYLEQYDRAKQRVYDFTIGELNAQYVYIGISNDCLHSGNAEVDLIQAAPCTVAEIDATVARLVEVGQAAIDDGLTPVYPKYPAFESLDLVAMGQANGFIWTIDQGSYEYLSASYLSAVSGLSDVVITDPWRGESTIDGIHPDADSARKGGMRVALDLIRDAARRH